MADDKLVLLTCIVEQCEDTFNTLCKHDECSMLEYNTALNRFQDAQKALWDYQDELEKGPVS